mgnify:FL=1|jgi:hypothetical protein
MELLTYKCKYSAQLPSLSQLEEAFWQEAVKLVRAEDGGAPNHPTKMRCLWNDEALAIYFYAIDPDIWGTYTKVNDPIYREEVVEAFLAPNPDDLTHYFELELSPRNVPFAARITNDAEFKVDFSWQPHWKTDVVVEGTLDNREDVDEYWLAQMLLPMAELCQGIKPGDRWRANFYRIDLTPREELSAWCPVLIKPANFHTPHRFGHFVFEG